MRIAVISDWFSEKMGYAENFLPKAFAALGHETHLITTNAQVYFDTPFYQSTYEPFLGSSLVEPGTKELDGYTLHRLPFGRKNSWPWRHALDIPGLDETLWHLKPDIVQTFDIACPSSFRAARTAARLGFKLYLESHLHASVMAQGHRAPGRSQSFRRFFNKKWLLGRFISRRAIKCYPISSDAADIALSDLGVEPSKIEICSLGVDHLLFRPPTTEGDKARRNELRRAWGIRDDEIVCIYTGRLTEDKGPLLLAEAVDQLVRKGKPFRALFVGSGVPDVCNAIARCRGCLIQPFVPARDLPPFYWTADIGVWPRQESTSQLDAMSCALPIIISNKATVRERVEGNGLDYAEGDSSELAKKIESLASPDTRRQLGTVGRSKIVQCFSWELIAQKRLQDYSAPTSPPPLRQT